MKKIKKLISDNILFILIIIAIIWFSFNYRLFIIATGSMQPTLQINELILVEKSNENTTYEIGDIVTYYDEELDATVTHRIVETVDNGFYTKGDNNNTRDLKIVNYNQIIGKVIHSSLFLGNLFVQYRYVIIVLLITIIVLLNVIFGKTIERKEEENYEVKTSIDN